ncbi:MAG TPA: LD-carboxypeptidase [Bacteroidales bacterium]|nr:LD-carboxypeptidase [Bacteroidales bacterium]
MRPAVPLRKPPYLCKGDTIGLIAPARQISHEVLEPAFRIFQEWGFHVLTGPHLFGSHHQFSGTDAERAADLQFMLERQDVKAIVCARGGYGSARIVDLVNWQPLQLHPKWIVGYSDITVFHAHLQARLGMESLHATMPLNFQEPGAVESLESLLKALTGELKEYVVDANPSNRKGMATGQLVGGNLSVLYSILGSPSDLDYQDKILFLEDLDEYLYHIDRMMVNLKRSGRLQHIRALVAGGFTEMRDNTVPFGKTAAEILMEITENLDIPLVLDFPAGHAGRNLALYMGRHIRLEVGDQVRMLFDE